MSTKEQTKSQKSKATTAIIEIVVVIAIFGILAAIFVPKYRELNAKLDAAAEASRKNDLANSLAKEMLASLIGGETTTHDILIIAESGENIRVYAYNSAERIVSEYKKSPVTKDSAKTFDEQKEDILKALVAEGCIKENNISADSWKTEENTKAIAERLELKGERAIYANYTLNASNFAPVENDK